jgi:aspartyl-tRNA(Asn)/glutamyl-tRNA(Gln) amidotransferase subunit C
MEINSSLIDQLAHLSRLRFDHSENESIRNDLEKMVVFVEKLREVPTEGVQPLLHIGKSTNVLREDIISGMVTREEGLRNAPQADAAFFKVPTVIRK